MGKVSKSLLYRGDEVFGRDNRNLHRFSFALEDVSDFAKELLFLGWARRSRSRLLSLGGVHGLDDHENSDRDNQKIDDGVNS